MIRANQLTMIITVYHGFIFCFMLFISCERKGNNVLLVTGTFTNKLKNVILHCSYFYFGKYVYFIINIGHIEKILLTFYLKNLI